MLTLMFLCVVVVVNTISAFFSFASSKAHHFFFLQRKIEAFTIPPTKKTTRVGSFVWVLRILIFLIWTKNESDSCVPILYNNVFRVLCLPRMSGDWIFCPRKAIILYNLFPQVLSSVIHWKWHKTQYVCINYHYNLRLVCKVF